MRHKYTAIFQSIYHSYGQDIETSKDNSISFSASELKLIFKLQQISLALRGGGESDFILDRLIELAEGYPAKPICGYVPKVVFCCLPSKRYALIQVFVPELRTNSCSPC